MRPGCSSGASRGSSKTTIALDQQERFVDQLARQPQRVDVVRGREQRADDVLDGDAAEALAEVVAYRLGPVARDDDQALERRDCRGSAPGARGSAPRSPRRGTSAARRSTGPSRLPRPAASSSAVRTCARSVTGSWRCIRAPRFSRARQSDRLDETPSRWRRRSGRRQEDECECGHRPDRRRQEEHSSPLRCDSRGLMPAAQGVGLVHTTRRDPLETRRQEGSGCSAVDLSLSGL